MPDYSDIPDLELAVLLKKNDHQAFAEIFNRYSGLLFMHAFKKLNDREDAKDVTQEVFSNVWIKRAQLTFQSNLSGYLYAAVRNRIFDLIAHRQVAARHLLSLQTYLDEGPATTDYLVREKLFEELIEKEIADLPPKMRRVFEMSRKENMTHKEIAEALNISEQTVTDQVKKALKILRPRIGVVISVIAGGVHHYK